MKKFYLQFIAGKVSCRISIAILIVMSLWMFLPSLGVSELESWDEAIYASIARDIYHTGDFINLHFNGEHYFNKPPFYMLLTSWSYYLFGLGCLLIGFQLARHLFNQKIAVLSVLLMLSNYHFFRTVRQGRMESMVAFFIVFACYSFYRVLEDKRWIYGLAVSTGLALISKGPMGFMPVLIILPFSLLYPKRLQRLFNRHTFPALVLFLIIAVPWYVCQLKIYGSDYVDEFVGFQLIDRITKAIEGHDKAWWYYLNLSSFYYVSSWSILVVPGLLFIVWKAVKEKKEELAFIGLFSWVILILFSFGVKTKLSWYIFTMYIPLSMGVALMLDALKGRWIYVKHVIIITSFLSILVFPILKFKVYSDSLKSMENSFKNELSESSKVYACNIDYPALNFYVNADLCVFNNFEELKKEAADSSNYFVLLQTDLNKMGNKTDYKILSENKNYIFFTLP